MTPSQWVHLADLVAVFLMVVCLMVLTYRALGALSDWADRRHRRRSTPPPQVKELLPDAAPDSPPYRWVDAPVDPDATHIIPVQRHGGTS